MSKPPIKLYDVPSNDAPEAMRCYRDSVEHIDGAEPWRPEIWNILLKRQDDPSILTTLLEDNLRDPDFDRKLGALLASSKPKL